MATVVAISLGIILLALTPALSVQVAWRRGRLRRALRREWPPAVRFLVRDDGGAWGVLLREQWLPRHASATIIIPSTEERGESSETRLARRVFAEWGLFHKQLGPAVAVVVTPGNEPIAVRVSPDRRAGANAETERQGLQAMEEFARAFMVS